MTPQNLNDTNSSGKFNNLTVDYTDGDVAILDNVKDLSRLQPIKPMSNMVALCTSGGVNMSINGKHTEIVEGDVVFFPPNVRIDYCDQTENFECKILCLSNHIIQGLLHDKIDVWNHAVYINQSNLIHMSDTCKAEFDSYYALLQSKIHRRDVVAHLEIMRAIIRALLLELCVILEQTGKLKGEGKPSQGKLLFNKFLNMLSTSDVKRKPINYYAGQLAITPKYLTMLCLKYSEKTASDWIILYTLEDIRFYLKNTGLSIKEISGHLGFANMSHFGSYVRKHIGMSPSEFRLKQQKA